MITTDASFASNAPEAFENCGSSSELLSRHYSVTRAGNLQQWKNLTTLIKEATAVLQDETASAEDRIKCAQAAFRKLLLGQLSIHDRSLGELSCRVPLSSREGAVLQLIRRGLSNKRIARSLGIAPETVKSHAKHILAKLNARTRAEAVALAAELNLI